MSIETTNNVTRKEKAVEITSLGDFIRVISDLTNGTELYKQVIDIFIEKIKQKSKDKYNKTWNLYYSTFLTREIQNIFIALTNFTTKANKAHKNELAEIYNTIRKIIESYCNNSEDILEMYPALDTQRGELILIDFLVPEENQVRPVQVYYRGEASNKWRTIPGILRENSYNTRESFYYHEIQVRAPKEFENQTHLNKLVTMQHYETPTRLLDLTSNPLSALYFACANKEQISNDGRVMLFPIMPGSMSYGDSDKALILSCLAPLTPFEKFFMHQEISDSKTDTYINDQECIHLNKLFLEICTEKPAFQRRIKFGDLLNPLFVQPNLINPRIVNQRGAFLLSGLDFNDDEAEERIKDRMSTTQIVIPANRKTTILKELDAIGINQATIYPNLDKIAGYLKSR